MEWLWDRPALVGGHVGRLPSGRWVLELTECVCVCVFHGGEMEVRASPSLPELINLCHKQA